MQCQICKQREATIHLTEISDGARTEMHVCQKCAAQQGLTMQSQMSVNELLSNLLASEPEDVETPSSEDKSCPQCGFTISRFREEGLLGCSRDYEEFEDVLKPLIEKAQDGHSVHCGKVPSKMPDDKQKQSRLAALRQQLNEAVRAENYELAAELRDQIEEMEK